MGNGKWEMDNRNKLAIRIDALQRLIMLNTLSGYFPLYIVTEYPKSGGTWIGQMISAYLNIPFPRNRRPPLKSCLMHGHMLPNQRLENVVCVFRDGRDVMVSWYYHRLFPNDHNSPALVARSRAAMPFRDFEDIRTNLPHFIEYIFEEESSSISPFKFTWSQFVDNWMQRQAIFVKYCDMIKNPHEELSRIIGELGEEEVDASKIASAVEMYSFENQSGRKPGAESKHSFLRRGYPGDWRNKFSREAAVVFNRLGGRQLIKLGFEPDDSWVETIE